MKGNDVKVSRVRAVVVALVARHDHVTGRVATGAGTVNLTLPQADRGATVALRRAIERYGYGQSKHALLVRATTATIAGRTRTLGLAPTNRLLKVVHMTNQYVHAESVNRFDRTSLVPRSSSYYVDSASLKC